MVPERVHDDVDRLPFHLEGIQLAPGDATTRVLSALSERDQPHEDLSGGPSGLRIHRRIDAFGSRGKAP